MILYILIALAGLSAVLAVITLVLLVRMSGLNRKVDGLSAEIRTVRAENEQTVQSTMLMMSDSLQATQTVHAAAQADQVRQLSEQLAHRNDLLQKSVTDGIRSLDNRMEQFRVATESRMNALRADNEKQLGEIRATVDEKLQSTLNERIGESFKQVSERLEQVYKGLGEMQTLASGVGDLKRVLSGVKTRGILGEYQLAAILEQILPREQYEENVATRPGSSERVEFAIKLPGDGDRPVYLPVDAKFPGETYQQLLDAYDSADPARVAAAQAVLKRTVRSEAKMIHDKYVEPPYTTEFAILFLPFEGLYAEVVRNGMVEELQRDFRINIAGPTTMAAILNSLQMGFRTLAIQKRSGEVWKVLGAVRTEFDKFGTVLDQARKQLDTANRRLEELVGTRTRQIQRQLRSVASLPEDQSRALLGLENAFSDEESWGITE
ncbi:MAG: DNA recombination protein RmuC [Clostridia bacterium]|nr:DNA recombination protein RmuC [Clostridia bacterium]